MSTRKYTPRPQLPEDFAAQLRALYVRGISPPPELRAAIAMAREKGWTLQAIAGPLGITREYVRQLAAKATDALPSFPIPDTPPKPAQYQKKIWPTLTPQQARRLVTLSRRAKVAGNMADDDPRVIASRDFAALVQHFLDEGFRIGHLAETLGVTKGALHHRLSHHGYRKISPSQMRPGSTGPVTRLREAKEV